MLTLTPFGQN